MKYLLSILFVILSITFFIIYKYRIYMLRRNVLGLNPKNKKRLKYK